MSRIHIRTDQEHRSIVEKELRREEGDVSTAAWFADKSRQTLNDLERHASVLRTIQEGDCVWGLHGKGVVWMPAIVERIIQVEGGNNANSNTPLPPSPQLQGTFQSAKMSSKRRIGDNVVYDLSYFMSNDSLQSAKAMESARKLLELPSTRPSQPQKSAANTLTAESTDDWLPSQRAQQPPPSLASMNAAVTTLVQLTNPVSSKRPTLSEKILCEAVFDEVCRQSGIDINSDSNQLDRSVSPSPGAILGGKGRLFVFVSDPLICML